MTDHRGLIDEARGWHREFVNPSGFHACETCVDDWPCLPARLAGALEQQEQRLAALENLAVENNWTYVPVELVARAETAERRGAELEAWRDNVSGVLRSWDMFEAGEWGGGKDGWGYHFELIRFLIRHYESTKVPAAPAPGSQP